jgi:hypothetical protein
LNLTNISINYGEICELRTILLAPIQKYIQIGIRNKKLFNFCILHKKKTLKRKHNFHKKKFIILLHYKSSISIHNTTISVWYKLMNPGVRSYKWSLFPNLQSKNFDLWIYWYFERHFQNYFTYIVTISYYWCRNLEARW